MRLFRLVASLSCLCTTACSTVDFVRPGSTDHLTYARLIPHFAEFCALSQIKQKRRLDAEILGGIGGHAVFYLNGACRASNAGQTTIQLCDEPGAEPADGVGISMNAHFRYAKWVATPGRDFFLHGNLRPEAPLTLAGYDEVQAEARRLGIYDGVDFHEVVYDDMPPDVSREAWKYAVSVGTDYGISLGRGRFCARVPVTRSQLAVMVEFLNAQNAPYRAREAESYWNLVQDNCIHLAHNALAAAGVWEVWPTGQPLLMALFNFPVPRNEFVNLMRRTGDTRLLNPRILHADRAARRALMEFGQLPLRPGALMESRPPQQPNDVYETRLKLIFYDEPTLGPYQRWFDAIRSDLSRSDLRSNLRWVLAEYRAALAERRSMAWWMARESDRAGVGTEPGTFAETYERFYALLAARAQEIEAQLAQLRATDRPR